MENLLQKIKGFFPEFKIFLNDLQNPTLSFVRDFYGRVLLELGADLDNIRRIKIEQLDLAEGIDIMPELNLVSAIRTAFPFLKFLLSDLLHPKAKRNAMLMARVMNFMQFCEARCSANMGEMEKIKDAKNDKIELLHKKDVAVGQLNSIAQEVDNCIQLKNQLEEEVQRLGSGEEVDEKKSLEEELARSREAYTNLEQLAQSVNIQLQSAIAEYESLKKEIVNNADQEEQILEFTRKEKERMSGKLAELKLERKVQTEMKDSLEDWLHQIRTKLIPVFRSLQQMVLKLRDTEIANKAANTELNEINQRKELILEQTIELEKQLQIIEEEYNNEKSKLEMEEANLKEELEEKNSLYNKKNKVHQAEKRELQEAIDKLKKRQQELRDEYAALKTEFKKVKEQLMLAAEKFRSWEE